MPNLNGTVQLYNDKRNTLGTGNVAGNSMNSLRDAVTSQGGPGYNDLNSLYAWVRDWTPTVNLFTDQGGNS